MQRVLLSYLNKKAHDEAAKRDSGKKSSSKHHQHVKSVLLVFQNCMMAGHIQHGHVNVEERIWSFPCSSHFDFSFLYEDHKYIHDTESKLLKALRTSVEADTIKDYCTSSSRSRVYVAVKTFSSFRCCIYMCVF